MKKVFIVVLATGLVSFAPAQAGANTRASCVGLIVSDHARWGDFAQVRLMLRTAATQLGLTYGALVSSTAHRHDGTHAICGGE
ncbi:hypothetical protein GCM10008955_07390 [Deinococcus malanensis]|uniref:Uncharacterized protein n=1 Tax=Deinococcus malanensis TaxID=1706855 RepID=A0ABQ2EM04_9DEIO|nr:hypothetical protein [Deinococcus malanensis]GGK16519.1 hypothetical protein GCM10008955_07390 [Deinococcus malanensis]